MYCVKCGTKAEKGQKRCLACGMRLISPEALLKLLKKADLEKKLSRMENEGREKPKQTDDFVKGYMARLHKDQEEASELKKKSKASRVAASDIKISSEKKKAKPVSVSEEIGKKTSDKRDVPLGKKRKDASAKIEKPSSDKEKKRVAPLLENPTQPKSRSIFDDYPKKEVGKKEASVRNGEKTKAGEKRSALEKKPKTLSTNPVVKLPEKKKTALESRKRDPLETRAANQLFMIPERKETRKKTAIPKKKPNARPASSARASTKRPDRAKGASSRNSAQGKKQAHARIKTASGGVNEKNRRAKRDDENFAEKYLRSIISMMLLTTTVVLMLMWSYATDTGNRTMAQLGLGSRKGYILLGDDCMTDGNYQRAVEHYYKALSKRVNYEAGIKLARAYRQTGEFEKETSALLLLMDRYQGAEEPYARILELYPKPDQRPEKVQSAIDMHER